MINVARFGEIVAGAAEKFPTYVRHMLALRDGFPAVVAAAHDAGVPIYVGTDAGGGITHGRAVDEMLALRQQAGMSTMDVSGPDHGERGSGSDSLAWSRVACPTWSCTTVTLA